MTMTDGGLALTAALAAAEREVGSARAAVQRAMRELAEAADAVVLHGGDGWLGPARDAFDERCRSARVALHVEIDELELADLALRGAL